MSDYQQAKKQETKKTSAPGQVKTKEKALEQTALLCPNCNAEVPDDALFCPECGFNLNGPSFCPNCGAAVSPEADICEACKTWLLEGQCMFCYAQLPPDADFCAECGNPKEGIMCHACGILSIFDFCSKCGKPLTEGAVAALELAKKDPDAKKLVDSIQETIAIEAELAEIEALIQSGGGDVDIETAPPSQSKMGKFSDSKMAALLKTGTNMDAAAARKADEARKIEERTKRQEEEKRQNAIQAAQARKADLERQKAKALADAEEAQRILQNKTFQSQQEARRFHNAVRMVGPRKWRCNAYGTLHDNGPNDCAEPLRGGHWVTS